LLLVLITVSAYISEYVLRWFLFTNKLFLVCYGMYAFIVKKLYVNSFIIWMSIHLWIVWKELIFWFGFWLERRFCCAGVDSWYFGKKVYFYILRRSIKSCLCLFLFISQALIIVLRKISYFNKLSKLDVFTLRGDLALDLTVIGLFPLFPTNFSILCKYRCILSSGVLDDADIMIKSNFVYKFWKFNLN